ncbi:putative EF-hand domain-containing protein [Helianthus anomalus]
MCLEIRAMKYLQAWASDFHKKHNICCVLDENYPNIDPFKDVVPFLRDCRIFKALTDRHKCYGSHVRFFWDAAHYVKEEKAIHSAVRIKDENDKDVDLPVKITVGDVRRVLDLQDKDEDPIISFEHLCKGF